MVHCFIYTLFLRAQFLIVLCLIYVYVSLLEEPVTSDVHRHNNTVTTAHMTIKPLNLESSAKTYVYLVWSWVG